MLLVEPPPFAWINHHPPPPPPAPRRRYSFIAAIALDLGIARAGPADGDQAADSAADDRHHRPPDLRHDAGLQLTQLGSAEEEDLVDAGHPAAQRIRRAQLADGVADDGADAVG